VRRKAALVGDGTEGRTRPVWHQIFREKLELQWATLKKCVRNPMQKAVLDKLDCDPIILDPDADNQQTITPK